MNVFDVDDNNHITGLITKIRNLYREFLSLDVAERGAGTSFLDFIKYSIRSKASTDGLTLSMRAATFAAKALNLALSMAVGALIGMAINGVVSAIADYAQRIDTAATKTKEEADAANNATSSLKDLVNAYEELGDKSGWGTEDFDQAKDIQEELLALAKEQGTLDENKVNQLDLQNGKYEEQLGLLKDITEEQLKASESKLIQSKDAQGNKLVKTAKDNNRSHFFSSVSANTNRGIMNELKDAGIDVFNKNGSFGAKDLNDPDSIAKYYSELGRALDYIVQNTTEAQRAAGGAYNTVYKYLMDEQSALRDDVDSYNDSTDAVNENVNTRRKLQAIDFWSDGKSNGMDVSYSFDKVNSAIETLKNTIDDFDASKLNDLLWGTNEGLTDEQAQALVALRKALTDMDFSADTDGVNAFIQALVQVGIVAQSSAGQVDELAAGAQKMEDISSKMDEIQSAYKASTSAMEEYNQYGYMSLDSLQSLLTMNTEYLNCLELVNGKLQINKQSYAELLAAEYAEAAATILSNAQHEVANLTADDTAESTDDLKEKTEAEKTALENLLPALKNATAATATYSAAQEFANEVEKAGERGVDPAKLEEITNRTNTQLSLLYTNMNAALKGGQALTNQLNGFGSSSKNAGKSSSTTSKSVADLSSAFDTLTKAMKEYNQYGYISADTMKSLIGVDDKFTACLTEQNGKLELNTAKFRTFVRAQLEEANAANDGGKSAGEMKKILDWLNSSVDSETISFEQLTDAIKGYGTAMDEAKEKTDAIKSAFSGLSEVMNNKTDRNNPFGLLDSDDVEKQHEALMQLAKDTDVFKSEAYNSETGEVDFNSKAFKDSVVEYLNGMADAAAKTGGAGAKAIEKNWRDAAKAIADGKISVEEFYNGLGYSLEKATKEIDDFQSGFSDITDIVDEYNLYGGLSIDNYQKLMALSPEYLSCLKLEGNQLVFNEAAYKQLLIDKLNDMITTYEQTDATKALADRLRELRDDLLNSKTGFKSAKDAAEEFKSAMSDLKEILSSVLSIFEKFNDKSNNDLKIWGDAMGKVIDKRIEALNKQKEALEKANDEEERAITLAKLKAELEKARTQRTVRKLTSNGYEWVADESAVKDAKDNLSDQQRQWRKEDAEKAIDDQIKKYNEFKDKLSEVMDDIGKSWKDYQKELEYTAQIQQMTITQMEGTLDDYHNKIIASLNTGSAITSIQNLIANLESLINTLTKVNNLYSMLKTGEYKDLGTKGLWNTIKGFFNKGGEEATGESANVVENFFKVIKSKVQTSGNGLIKTFSGIWEKIKGGAQSLFNGSGSGGGIISTFVNGFKAIGNAVSKSKIGSTILGGLSNVGTALVRGGGKLLAGAGKLIGAAGPALAAAGPYAIPIVAAAGLGIYGATKNFKHQKEIWSNKEDGFGKKTIKSVATFFWDISPIGAIVNLCKDIFGKNKEIADNTKNNTSSGTSSSSEGVVIGNIKGKKAAGSKSIKQSGRYNVDELGPELIVRQPTSGRYTYLETGDGVVPADITSRLFDMGGNPDRWFTEQMERNAGISNVQNRTIEGDKITIGDIYIQNPVGGVDDLAREINQRMPAMYKQIQSKR